MKVLLNFLNLQIHYRILWKSMDTPWELSLKIKKHFMEFHEERVTLELGLP